jgi:phosphate transport system substrate-binding protein
MDDTSWKGETLKGFIIFGLFLFAGLPIRAATNPPATALLLHEQSAIELTAGLTQYENPPKVPGKLTSIGSGVATILINRWASEFATLHPEAELNIQGGGSEDGLGELLAGRVDLVPISRKLPADYIARFKAKFGYEPAQIIVAQDAIGVYVNKINPIQGLTLAQLDAVYSREPKRGGGRPEFWGEVGVSGALEKERITRVSLSRVHGTYMQFREEVMRGADYRFDVQFESVPSSLVQAAGADATAIGCASIMFATARTRFVPLQAADGQYLLPTYTNTVSGRYPLVRPIPVVFNRKPDGSMNPVAREFLRFAVSRRGQRIIALAESYPITVEQQGKALEVLGAPQKPRRGR